MTPERLSDLAALCENATTGSWEAHRLLLQTRSDHAIRWEHDRDTVRATVMCHAPEEADCHLTSADPECDCESWGRIERREDGTIWHQLTDGYRDLTLPRDVPQWHRVKPQGECNVAEFMNADPYLIPEMATDDTPEFVIAETPIEPVWDGDNYLWKAVSGE